MRPGERTSPDLLFHDQDDVMARLKGGVQLDEVGVVQLVHHLDLIPHHVLRDKQTKGRNKCMSMKNIILYSPLQLEKHMIVLKLKYLLLYSVQLS